ncbi:hypothetical protein nvc2_041 [Namao virus]|nr:hypothetical protein nvc2_041 [Namao virus]
MTNDKMLAFMKTVEVSDSRAKMFAESEYINTVDWISRELISMSENNDTVFEHNFPIIAAMYQMNIYCYDSLVDSMYPCVYSILWKCKNIDALITKIRKINKT